MRRFALLFARIALGSAFLSAVAARFALWGHYSQTRGFGDFIRYTAEVLSFVPASLVPLFAVAATILETTFALALIAGVKVREAAIGSAILLAMFATSMAISFGIKSPLDASVFSASAAGLLLAVLSGDRSTAARTEGREDDPQDQTF
jgi:uncharacterized membrane protein YphA (DoxX/SURF4 family)